MTFLGMDGSVLIILRRFILYLSKKQAFHLSTQERRGLLRLSVDLHGLGSVVKPRYPSLSGLLPVRNQSDLHS